MLKPTTGRQAAQHRLARALHVQRIPMVAHPGRDLVGVAKMHDLDLGVDRRSRRSVRSTP